MTIVASQIVQAIPSVLSAGGVPASEQGLFLTSNIRIPLGQVLSFPTPLSVGAYFGLSSPEYAAAQIYFSGFTGSSIIPPAMLFTAYPAVAASAFLRGGSLASILSLGLLPALSGTLIVTVNGTVNTSSTITISANTAPSTAAGIILAAFTTPLFGVTFDAVSSAFVFTSTLTGTSASTAFATGTLATGLALTLATGAVISQGAAAAVPGTFMSALLLTTTNWGSFTTLFNPDASTTVNTQKLAFAMWNATQNNDYIYACWDPDPTAIAGTSTTCLGALLTASAVSGTMLLWGTDNTKAVFACGIGASINFTQFNGRITYAFKSQSGLTPDVNDPTIAANLIANGYNFYGGYALATNNWTFLYPGSISGQYKWADAYINQMWMNNAFQLALMTLLTNTLSVPYNAAGYALIDAGCQVVILAALNFGAIRAGVPPSALEAAEMDNAAGVKISPIMATRGWFLQILPASAQTRGIRASPPITFWYMDGGAVQQLIISSVEVQ